MAGDNSPLRLSSFTIAERKFAQGKAPVFHVLLQLAIAGEGTANCNRCTTMELPFVFDHVDAMQFMNGAGRPRYLLADSDERRVGVIRAHGQPGPSGAALWRPFDPERPQRRWCSTRGRDWSTTRMATNGGPWRPRASARRRAAIR